jgi:hypothetical protein
VGFVKRSECSRGLAHFHEFHPLVFEWQMTLRSRRMMLGAHDGPGAGTFRSRETTS